jgi:hypothetical protein
MDNTLDAFPDLTGEPIAYLKPSATRWLALLSSLLACSMSTGKGGEREEEGGRKG